MDRGDEPDFADEFMAPKFGSVFRTSWQEPQTRTGDLAFTCLRITRVLEQSLQRIEPLKKDKTKTEEEVLNT